MPRLVIGGKSISPCPFLEISKTHQRTNSEILGATYSLSLTGFLLSNRGSPDSHGHFSDSPSVESISDSSRLSVLLRKQEALREAFSTDGLELSIVSDDIELFRCFPRIVGPIVFEAGPWLEVVKYSIQLEADNFGDIQEFDLFISDAQETWSIEPNENYQDDQNSRTYSINHSVSAIGKRGYDQNGLISEAWEQARQFVLQKLEATNDQILSTLPAGLFKYNRVRNEQIDIQNGSYSIQESYIAADPTNPVIEDFSVETTRTNETGLVNVEIRGQLIGLETRNDNLELITSKYENANDKFSLLSSGLAYTRAANLSQVSLNPIATANSVGRNPITGNISYSFSYDDRQSRLLTSAISEKIAIADYLDTDEFVEIKILGRKQPLLMDLGTKKAFERTLEIAAVFLPTQLGNPAPDAPAISGLIDSANPAFQGFSTVFKTENSDHWEPKAGIYSKIVKWTFTS